mmetsp:Transcript_8181/g.15181  ORF Transcript_8181/g.15181 Transcript_8181/m.15181 type:complete len:348 (-) Transcript_8181:159-1202(-)|eukprot:CAMPEP_0197516762 /NCGR_PEP_ID=MMETSP1318-20131121/1689_1 /TAXON_ID=552666 /ORGANISM="Partenskyella glossopodia, Strain RCC365" /LENGTH=347 /DNA_ID=CAMNT_0043065767 /DNA_START=86 /DNA_END=1129 /DNA_ORIENTATION=+
MDHGDPEKFIATTYSVWATAKTLAIYSVLIYLGQQRYTEIDGLYGSKSVCKACYDEAVANPGLVFEYGRCDKSFDVPSDQSNLLKSDNGWSWNWTTQVSQVKDYVVTPAVCLAIAGFCWLMVVGMNCMIRAPRYISVLLAFVFNYLFGLTLMICTGMIYNLYLRDFGNGTRCYVQVVNQAFTNAIGILSGLWGITIVVHHCFFRGEGNTTTSIWFLGLTQIIVIGIIGMYTAKAVYATMHGLPNAAIFTLLGWQMITEVPALAFMCKTLFDLSTTLAHYGYLPQTHPGALPIETSADDDLENSHRPGGLGRSMRGGSRIRGGSGVVDENAGLLQSVQSTSHITAGIK